MSPFAKTLGRLAFILVCLSWLAVMSTADAQEGAAPTLEPPALPPPMPPAPSQPPTLLAPPSASQPTERRTFLRPAEPDQGTFDNNFQTPERSGSYEFGSYAAPSEESMPQPLGDIQVRPTPPVKYDTDRGARRMYRDSGAVDVLMLVQNPADGCYYEIPLCVPACCAGEAPSMECDEGIFGRGKVRYCWPCGFEAEIKFRHVLGDIKVDYDA